MNVTDKIIDDLAQRMANEIDKEVLWGMLQGIGWTRVMIGQPSNNAQYAEISLWLLDNVKNPYERRGRDFIFESERDATLFILRWV